MAEVDDIIQSFGVRLVSDLRQSLVKKKVTFGGGGESRLSAKIRYTVTRTAEGFVFSLVMPEYGDILDKGRRPGKVSKEGRAEIEDWAARKGIIGKFQTSNLQTRQDKQAKGNKRKSLKKLPFQKAKKAIGFLIARKVTKKGYKGNQFLTEVLNDGRIDRFKQDLANALKKEITFNIQA